MDLLLPIIIVILLVVLAVLFLVQRRQRTNNEVLPPPEFGQQTDYTNPDLKAPESFADRVRNAPLAIKLLVPLALLALLIVGGVLYATLQPVGGSANLLPTAAAGEISAVNARLSNATTVLIQAATNLPSGTAVQAQLLEDGQPFAWNTPESAVGKVADGQIQIGLLKRPDSPTPNRAKAYTVALNASGAQAAAVPLSIPQLYASEFFANVAEQPTSAPTNAPTVGATAKPPAVPATQTPLPTATVTFTATVANGGNLRELPNRTGKVLDQNNAFETVIILQKTADGAWYQVTNPRGVTGWFSASLLTVSPDVAAKVAVEGSAPPPVVAVGGTAVATTPTVTVVPGAFTGVVHNGGNLRKAPNLSGDVLDQNNAGEIVTLLAKNGDGTWYRLTNPRGVTGWFSATLLTIQPSVAAKVKTEQP